MTFSEEYKNELYSFIANRIETWLDKEYKRDALNTRIEYDTEDIADGYYDSIGHEMGAEAIYNGVSKLVMKFNEYPDVVFKFPFIAISVLEPSEDDDFYLCSCDYDFNDYEDYYRKMSGAYNEYVECLSDDYCDCEQEVYQIARCNGISDMFAETSYLGTTKSGVKVYMSSRCDAADFTDNDDSRKSAKTLLDNNNDYIGMSESVGGTFIEDYGIDRFKELLDFLSSIHIGDIHSGNVMENSNNKVVITDYSDYNGD